MARDMVRGMGENMLRRRIYLQIYGTIIGSLVLVVVLVALLWNLFDRNDRFRETLAVTGGLAFRDLPGPAAPADSQRAAIAELARELDIDITLYDRGGQLIAASGRPSPPPPEGLPGRGWRRLHGAPAWALVLPDGRRLVIDLGRQGPHRPLRNLILFLGTVALGVGLGAYPFVRRLTRRIERLQTGVDRIGAGDLSARVEVEGRDEVARLASSFNDAAAKIEKLVGAHRMLLANASHELRTPLARIRLGIELLKEGDPGRRAALERDIAELDGLIDEMLLMSRLDAGAQADLSRPVDLVALAAEECARYEDCALEGTAPEIRGDPALLRRMLRNLLENASVHGGPPLQVELAEVGGEAWLTVRDGGAGIPPAEREKVFEPFYRAAGRQNAKGYGLGLPLVRQIAGLHGGSVSVPEAAGSAIRVVLPLRRNGARPGAA